MLPPKKRYRIEVEETTVEYHEAMTEGRMADKDSAEKSKIFPSVFRHTSCPNHSIGYLAREFTKCQSVLYPNTAVSGSNLTPTSQSGPVSFGPT